MNRRTVLILGAIAALALLVSVAFLWRGTPEPLRVESLPEKVTEALARRVALSTTELDQAPSIVVEPKETPTARKSLVGERDSPSAIAPTRHVLRLTVNWPTDVENRAASDMVITPYQEPDETHRYMIEREVLAGSGPWDIDVTDHVMNWGWDLFTKSGWEQTQGLRVIVTNKGSSIPETFVGRSAFEPSSAALDAGARVAHVFLHAVRAQRINVELDNPPEEQVEEILAIVFVDTGEKQPAAPIFTQRLTRHGHFTFDVPLDGKYLIVLVDRLQRWRPTNERIDLSASRVDVTALSTRLDPGVAIEGTLSATGLPIDGCDMYASVQAHRDPIQVRSWWWLVWQHERFENPGVDARTELDGSFRIRGLAEDNYSVQIAGGRGHVGMLQSLCGQWRRVDAPASTVNFTVQAARASFTVLRDGKPLQGARLGCVLPSEQLEAVSDEAGHCVFFVPPVSSYALQVTGVGLAEQAPVIITPLADGERVEHTLEIH